MTSVNTSNQNDDGTPILYPYKHNPNSRQRRRARGRVTLLMAAFCLLWGMVFAFMAPALIVLWLAPVGVLMMLVIWALPDMRTAPTRALEGCFFAFVIVLTLWPNYLSVSLHQFGLPWVSMQRIVSVPIALIFLICVSVSPKLRNDLAESLRTQPLVWKLLVAFVVIQTYCIFISPLPIQSLDRYVNMQTTWTLIFFVAAYLFAKPGAVERWVRTLWLAAVITGLIGIAEWRVHHVLWVGHLPSFLSMDPLVEKELAPEFRNYTSIYRVQSVFGTSLGFGEFISLTTPFVLNYGMSRLRTSRGIAALLTVPFLFFVAYITNARSAIIGLLVGLGVYGFYWGYTQMRLNPDRLIGRTIVMGYPVFSALALASTFIFGRIRRMVWGGGETASSTFSRTMQYHKGIPLVFKHPWGYGIGRGGVTLGIYEPNGMLTIDTYYLAIALDYGVLGFLVYYAMFISGVFYSGKYAAVDDGTDRECSFLGAISASLISFLVIKSVFSQQDNHPLVYMMLGMAAALSARVAGQKNQRLESTEISTRGRRVFSLLSPNPGLSRRQEPT
jgi:hypothetical protein